MNLLAACTQAEVFADLRPGGSKPVLQKEHSKGQADVGHEETTEETTEESTEETTENSYSQTEKTLTTHGHVLNKCRDSCKMLQRHDQEPCSYINIHWFGCKSTRLLVPEKNEVEFSNALQVTFDGKTFEMKHDKHFVIGSSLRPGDQFLGALSPVSISISLFVSAYFFRRGYFRRDRLELRGSRFRLPQLFIV